MRIPQCAITLALAMWAANVAIAAPPPAPHVTMGADIKLLRFDWDPVPGASFYRLWVKPGGSRYIAASERIPASITQAAHPIAVHLQDWVRTRYVVTACNASGCTSSRALDPRPLMLETIGYLKASNSEAEDLFGRDVELSADGYTLAVVSSEASNASGVNGNQADNSSHWSGAVYVFRRRGHTWHQEAYLKAGVNQPEQFFGSDGALFGYEALAISADGSMLAAGSALQDVNGVRGAGVVYVFRRSGSTWSLLATLHSPTPVRDDYFGLSVDISHDGRTLKVHDLDSNDRVNVGLSTHIFVRPGNTWQFSQTVPPLHASDECQLVRLSGDGNTLVGNCFDPDVHANRMVTMKRTGDTWRYVTETLLEEGEGRRNMVLSPDASVMALTLGSTVNRKVGVYRWNFSGWTLETQLTAPDLNEPTGSPVWGNELALGSDGRLLAIGDTLARDDGAGISPTPLPGTVDRGAVYLYQRSESGAWPLLAVVKAPSRDFGDSFGASVSLSASGRTLAVGGYGEDSDATGIDGDRENENALHSGAAYLY